MLNLAELVIGRNQVPLVSGINGKVETGSVTAFMGLNGSGKSTLLETVMGNLAPVSGSVQVDSEIENQAKIMAIVHSELPGFQELTVYEFISLGRTPYLSGLGTLKEDDLKIVNECINEFNLTGLAEKTLSHLSDGQKQKCCIAKSFVQDTPLILMDEPLNHLDLAAKVDVLLLIKKMAREKSKTILLTIHDWELVRKYVENLWLINKEGQFQTGLTSEFIHNGEVERTFRLNR